MTWTSFCRIVLKRLWYKDIDNSFILTSLSFLAVCFQSPHMKHFQTNFIRHLRITNALLSQNCLEQISLFLIMLARYYLISAPTSAKEMRNCCIFISTVINLQVQYQSDHFLDKNKDYVVAEHQDLLSASNCPFVAGLFPPLPEETSKSSKFSSIGSRFKVSFFS